MITKNLLFLNSYAASCHDMLSPRNINNQVQNDKERMAASQEVGQYDANLVQL